MLFFLQSLGGFEIIPHFGKFSAIILNYSTGYDHRELIEAWGD